MHTTNLKSLSNAEHPEYRKAHMTICNPYQDAFVQSWFKGDLHIHSDASDGRASLAQIRERLRECGFDFAALADHNRFCPSDETDAPVLIGNSEMRMI